MQSPNPPTYAGSRAVKFIAAQCRSGCSIMPGRSARVTWYGEGVCVTATGTAFLAWFEVYMKPDSFTPDHAFAYE